MSEPGAAEAVNEIGYRAEEIRTGEPTGSARLKWVVIVDRTLSVGQAVNAAVCVAAATSPDVAGLLGPGGSDASGTWHRGLPWAGCSILAADGTELVALRGQALARGFHVTAMPAAAQATRVYNDYLAMLACTEADDLGLLALGMIGPRNRVAKLVRPLELLRDHRWSSPVDPRPAASGAHLNRPLLRRRCLERDARPETAPALVGDE